MIFGAGHPLASAAAALFFVDRRRDRHSRPAAVRRPRSERSPAWPCPISRPSSASGSADGCAAAPGRRAVSANYAIIEDIKMEFRPASRDQRRLHSLRRCRALDPLLRRQARLQARCTAPKGFADFSGAGLTLALWEIDHISRHTGISNVRGAGRAQSLHRGEASVAGGARRLLCASSPARACRSRRRPADYPWNAYCCYFTGPDDEVWELYAWREGGAPGKVA